MVFLCKGLLSDSESFLACRTAEMSLEELRGDEKGWSVLGRDEDSWKKNLLAEMMWDEVRRACMIWDEMKCGVWSAKCEVGDVKSTVWSLKKRFTWRCIVMWLCAGHILGQQHGNRFAQSTHGRAWLAHGACKFYRWKGSYSIFLRQLSPRLVRVLLVYLYPLFMSV